MSDEVIIKPDPSKDGKPLKPKPRRKNGVVYDVVSGEIISTIGSNNFDAHAHDDFLVLEGSGKPESHFVTLDPTPTIEQRVTGVFVANQPHLMNDNIDAVVITCPDPCFIKINDKPAIEVKGGQYIFTTNQRGIHLINLVGKYMASEIVLRSYTEKEARQITNDKINAEWEAKQAGGIDVDTGKTIISVDTGIASRAFLSLVVSRAGQGKINKQKFKTKDNKQVELTPADIILIEDNLAAHIDDVFNKAQAKKNKLKKAKTLSEILDFDIKGDW